MSWERWNHWTLVDLPELNRSVLSGREPAANLTAALRRALTDDLSAGRLPTVRFAEAA